MCTIEGSVRILIGQHDHWSRGLDVDVAEALERSLRSQVHGLFDNVPDLKWALKASDLDNLPEELEGKEELPYAAHRHFVDYQLSVINRERPKDQHITCSAAGDDEIKCCFRWENEWHPCHMQKLLVGEAGKETPLTATLEHEELAEPLEVPLWIQVMWVNHLGEPDVDADTRERIKEIVAHTSGEPLKKALEILEASST